MSEVSIFLNQPVAYNVFETVLTLGAIGYMVLVIKLCFEKNN